MSDASGRRVTLQIASGLDIQRTIDGSYRSSGTIDRVKHSEARYRTLVEQIPAITFMASLQEGMDENEIYVSPHIETMLGFTQEEWLGDPFLWHRQLHPDDRQRQNDG